MNRYEKIDPEQIVKLREETTLSQYRAVKAAAESINADNTLASDELWGITAAAAYRAGRLSMWQDMRKAKNRAPKTQTAAYRWVLHRLTDRIKDEDQLKYLCDLAQYLQREEH